MHVIFYIFFWQNKEHLGTESDMSSTKGYNAGMN